MDLQLLQLMEGGAAGLPVTEPKRSSRLRDEPGYELLDDGPMFFRQPLPSQVERFAGEKVQQILMDAQRRAIQKASGKPVAEALEVLRGDSGITPSF